MYLFTGKEGNFSLKRLFSFLLIILSFLDVAAQEKFEKESRLAIDKIPPKARSFVDSMNFTNKIKWYKEQGLTEETIEAKTKFRDKKYSIEFSLSGMLQDIEVEVEYKTIPEDVQDRIESQLDTLYRNYKICKVQAQYTGKEQNLLLYLPDMVEYAPHTLKYEIVLKGRSKNEKSLFEFLFSDRGIIEKKSKIIFRSIDNIEF